MFNPEIQPVYQDPFIQPENNTSRWIQLPSGEVIFINGRLDQRNTHDQPESSAMGELRAPMEMQKNLSAEDWPLCIEFCLEQDADNTKEGDANEGQLNHTSPLGLEENNSEAENNPPHNTSIEGDPQHASLKRMRDPNDSDEEIEGKGQVRRPRD